MHSPLTSSLRLLAAAAAVAAFLPAQGGDLLYTTSGNERTLSGSGGTVLRNITPNEIVRWGVPCANSAEKWVPRAAVETMAGDADNDNSYYEPALLGSIDALMTAPTTAGGITNARTIFYSPSTALGTTISGGAGLRPGDIGRIVRNGALDGQVQYFIRAEAIQVALGMPPTPVVIDVDAAAFSPNLGLYLSLDVDQACTPCGGPTVIRDGDIFVLSPGTYTTSAAGTIATTMPGSAVRVYHEGQMSIFTAAANVADRNGVCVTGLTDVEAIDIDWQNPSSIAIPGCTGVAAFVPNLIFTGDTLTGGSVLTTAFGGQIYNHLCGPLGTACGAGPTLGVQVGLRPPTAAQGIASHLTALTSTRAYLYTAESKVHQIPFGTAAQIDFNSPSMTWVILTFAPTGPGVVAPSSPFVWGVLGHPDYYAVPNFMGTVPAGFSTYTSPVIPWPCDLVFQGITITTAGGLEASTPTMVEVF